MHGEIVSDVSRVVFPSTAVGRPSSAILRIRNAGRAPVQVEVGIEGDFEGPGAIGLAGGEQRDLELRFRASRRGLDRGVLTLTDDTSNRVTVELEAEARDREDCAPPASACEMVTFDEDSLACSVVPVADGTLCTEACLASGAVCSAGQCAGAPLSCDDGIACTTDACVPGTGCTHVKDDAACAKENPCANLECDGTGCRWEPKPDGSVCGHDLCSGADVCIGGQCVWREKNGPRDPSCAIVGMRVANWYACALRADGTVWCLGDNTFGQLGNPAAANWETKPVKVVGLPPIKQLAQGYSDQPCALSVDGDMYCWGNNCKRRVYEDGVVICPNPSADGLGLLGTGNFMDIAVRTPEMVPGIGKVRYVFSGSATCAVRDQDESLWCWGENREGETGVASNCPLDFATTPEPVGLLDVIQLADAYSALCALDSSGVRYCWGETASAGASKSPAERGTCTPGVQISPAPIAILGPGRTAVDVDGAAWRWFNLPWDQKPPSYQIGGVNSAVQISEQLALMPDGNVLAWGVNGGGILGNGTSQPWPQGWQQPQPVAGIGGATWLSTDGHSACAGIGGRVFCWGESAKNWISGTKSYQPAYVPFEIEF